jgi:hypothetical protein
VQPEVSRPLLCVRKELNIGILAYIVSYTSGTAIKVNLFHPFPSNAQIVGKYSVNCIQMIKTFNYGNK